MTKKLFFVSMLSLLMVLIPACKKNDDSGDQDLEKYAAYTAVYLAEAAGLVYTISTTTLSNEVLAQIWQYNNGSGTWQINQNSPSGYTVEMTVKFYDAQGNVQKYFNEDTTTRIEASGTATGPEGSTSFNIIIDGASNSSTAYTVNGNGTGSYSPYTGSFVITNVVINKSSDLYPESGTITVTSGGDAITITFDGSNTAKGTYTHNGKSITFYINLDTGAISY